MKVFTSTLDGRRLRWAMASAQGLSPRLGAPNAGESEPTIWVVEGGVEKQCPSFETDWGVTGPLNEREGVVPSPQYQEDVFDTERLLIGSWQANVWNHSLPDSRGFMQWSSGSTSLIASVRCHVELQLGKEVEIPDVLISTPERPIAVARSVPSQHEAPAEESTSHMGPSP